MGVTAGPSKRDEDWIKAFEMKCIRKISRVLWTQEKKNAWVLEASRVELDLLNLIKRIWSYFGQVMTKEGDCLQKEIMQGTVPGARKQRRPRTRWIDNMEKWAENYNYWGRQGTEGVGINYWGRQGTEGVGIDYWGRQGTEGVGIDLTMKPPTLGMRMVKDKTSRPVESGGQRGQMPRGPGGLQSIYDEYNNLNQFKSSTIWKLPHEFLPQKSAHLL